MTAASKDSEARVREYLEQQAKKSLLRFITCGSVDDGKSTLIGRLLYESKLLFEDQLSALEADSARLGTQGEGLDFALLVDGLAAEREQGITIDVAYRYFTTDHRKFIVADTPGHEQYTRNMATGASTADLAVILVDARQGILTQTRRHSFIVSLLGIRHVVLAINKMDLMGYDQAVYNNIVADYMKFAATLPNMPTIQPIPMSALTGCNVVEKSPNMDWFGGPSLISYLETVDVESSGQDQAFAMPVQLVSRPSSDFRGFSGMISGGTIHPGDTIKCLPNVQEAKVERIVTQDGDLEEAVAGQSVTLSLDREIDVSRGDIIVDAKNAAEIADQFEITLLWMNEQPMLAGRNYVMKIGTLNTTASITSIKHRVDVNTMAREAVTRLELNEIAHCNISVGQRIAFRPYAESRDLGGFILIDRLSNETVGMGLINFALRRSNNIHIQALDVDRTTRAAIKNQKPVVLWFTGLSGSGKSTIANLVESYLVSHNHHTVLLDGDNVRHGLNRDLGFTDADRVENIRRIGEVSRLMADAGLIALVSFISPFTSERRMAREMLPAGEFVEIFVSTPLEVAEKRDVKGLYKKARSGEIKNFTGIESPYEVPENPEITIDTTTVSAEQGAEQIITYLREQNIIR